MVLGLGSENTWDMNSSRGFGIVVRQHIRYELSAVVLGIKSVGQHFGNELTAVVRQQLEDEYTAVILGL